MDTPAWGVEVSKLERLCKVVKLFYDKPYF